MGDVAEWLRSGLQIRGHRFESGRRLHQPLKKKDQPVSMPNTVNKDYVLNIIKQIDHPRNSNIIQMIEDINISEEKVKIIVNSELTSVIETITGLWQSFIEKDINIKSCSVIYTKHSAPNLKNVPLKNDPFLNKFDLSHLGKIIFIASGKGGVGKSTISNNIATLIAELSLIHI